MKEFLELSTLEESNGHHKTGDDMIRELVHDHQTISQILTELLMMLLNAMIKGHPIS